jgi:hypothetical protein
MGKRKRQMAYYVKLSLNCSRIQYGLGPKSF